MVDSETKKTLDILGSKIHQAMDLMDRLSAENAELKKINRALVLENEKLSEGKLFS